MKQHKDVEADFSQEVLAAFRKRTKPLSRRGAMIEGTPVKEIVDGRESDISRADVKITYQIEGTQTTLRLHVWADRWVWVDVRRSSKSGWVWEFTAEGRFVLANGARELVSLAEDTISASHDPAAAVSQKIAAIWSKCLAVGPRLV